MVMKMKEFLKGNSKGVPTLYMDMTFVEMKRPILFTCIDDSGDRYICSCHCANGEKCEWVAVHTTSERLIALLTNRISIREIFDDYEKQGILITLYAGEDYPVAQKIEIKNILPEILPTKGYFMDAENGEFDEEIAKLRAEEAMRPYVNHYFIKEKFDFSSRFIKTPIQFDVPDVTIDGVWREYRPGKVEKRIIAVGV